MTTDKIAELAEEIADDLFTNGNDQKANRLILELPGGMDGGGWCRDAVVLRVARKIQDALAAAAN